MSYEEPPAAKRIKDEGLPQFGVQLENGMYLLGFCPTEYEMIFHDSPDNIMGHTMIFLKESNDINDGMFHNKFRVPPDCLKPMLYSDYWLGFYDVDPSGFYPLLKWIMMQIVLI